MLEWLRKKWRKWRKKKNEEEEQILSVDEIAEMIGAFPSDVEETVKELQEQGLVKCYMAEGKIYVVPTSDADIEDLLDSYSPTDDKKDKYSGMYG